MSQTTTWSTNVHSGQKAANSGCSGEQQLAGNTSKVPYTEITRELCYEEGTWKYVGSVLLLFQIVCGQYCDIKFAHTIWLNADVPLMSTSGHFDGRDVELRFKEILTERRCERTTEIRRRTGMPSGSSYSSQHGNQRGDEKQVWQLVDAGLNRLVRHFREECEQWNLTPAADCGQEANDGMCHSGDSSQKTLQYAREETGTQLHAEVTGTQSTFHCTVINS